MTEGENVHSLHRISSSCRAVGREGWKKNNGKKVVHFYINIQKGSDGGRLQPAREREKERKRKKAFCLFISETASMLLLPAVCDSTYIQVIQLVFFFTYYQAT